MPFNEGMRNYYCLRDIFRDLNLVIISLKGPLIGFIIQASPKNKNFTQHCPKGVAGEQEGARTKKK